jgi:RNA polymerase sigma factor (sigma-70 family)
MPPKGTDLMIAIEAVYRQKFAAFHRVAINITGDPELARDSVQEAFARAIRRRADFRGDGALEGWIWRTVINAARDQCRVAKRTVPAEQIAELPDPTASRRQDHAEDHLRGRIAALPERQRTTLFLRYYADMSYSDIGAALEITIGTVSATLNAAHRALRSAEPNPELRAAA